MARHKRMRLEPIGQQQRRKRSVPLPPDRLFLSRRMFLAKSAVVGGFAALAGKLGWMQIAEGDRFEARAQNNVIKPIQVKANRGLIYDRHGRTLAKNETAFQVRLVPGLLPEEGTPERRRVLDTLITELKLPDCLVLKQSEVPDTQWDEVFTVIAELRGRQNEQIPVSVQAMKDAAAINYVVLLNDDLGIDQASMYREKSRSVPGLRVMNYVEYLLANAGGASSRLVVKTDVPRETALRIAANGIHLPGVEINDDVLVRRYPAGPMMSHLLGFVGPVSDEEYEENVTPGGYPIYELDDRIGKDGLELTMEEALRGTKGQRIVYQDVASGAELGVVPGTENATKDPEPGKNLRLTIDLELQSAATRALRDYCRYSNEDRQAKGNTKGKEWSNSGAVVAMDPRTGEVLAMVSYPQYDNELLVEGISEAKWEQLNDVEEGRPYFNRAIASAQPPGSTIKCFLAAAGLHEGTLTTDTTYTCTGAIRVPLAYNHIEGNTHPCWLTEGGHGVLDMTAAIKTSCDVYFYNVGTQSVPDLWFHDYDVDTREYLSQRKEFEGLGIDKIHATLTEHFWFGQFVDFDLPGEMPGLVPSQAWKRETFNGEGWSAGETIITSIGQGFFQATPLQLTVNTVALANGGKIYRPMLVKETTSLRSSDAGTPMVDDVEASEVRRPEILREMKYQPEHIDPIRQAMRDVVHDYEGLDTITNGSASYLIMDDYSYANPWPRTNPDGTPEKDMIYIAGKTGTAEVANRDDNLENDRDPETGTYYNQHAWFTCFAPYDEPEIAVSVLVEYGGEGAHYAAPVADIVLRSYFETTGRRPRTQETEDGRRVSVLREDGEPELDIDNAEPLNWFQPGDTYSTVVD